MTPRAGVALPVVGALAGGPVGAAAGLFVQTLIGKKLNRAARSRYHVTGGWDKPVITLVAKEKFDVEEAADASREEAGESDSVDPQHSSSRAGAERMMDPVQAVIDALPSAEKPPGAADPLITPREDSTQGSQLKPVDP